MQEIHKQLIKECIEQKISRVEDFSIFKKRFYSQNKLPQPTNADIRDIYEKMISKKEIKRNPSLESAMLSRAVRTQSGVAVIAVLTKPSDCPGKCIFCPTEKGMPKSYLSNEPAVMRAIMNKFDPYRQVQSRIKALELNGHSTDKIELIVMGGTFSYFPKTYQKRFIKECFRACNDYRHGTYSIEHGTKNAKKIAKMPVKEELLKEQKKNEKAAHRIVGLTLETRPDYVDEKEILNFRNLGCTRVELGIQSIFDDILEKNNRGHGVKEIVDATKLLKDAGFKINYHMMPGLLGSTPKRDFEMFETLFSDSRFQPDMLKIYPLVVVKNSELYKIWKDGKYKALTDEKFKELVVKIKNEVIPPYTRIQRLIRDVPLPSIEAGPKISNLRQIIEKESQCKCIRCREVKGEFELKEKIILDRIDYSASEGKEIFLQFVSPDKKKLFALLRLRIPSSAPPSYQGGGWEGVLYENIPALKNAALIREVHTYGKLTAISKKEATSPQHIGLGKKLLKEAERIAKKEFGAEKIAVISGVGVRGYYRKNGYRLRDTYMVKSI
ncbi:MAG: tRNA uridine(34) 5-carboxymethylaminomethyl modification radical SAM/GNAT enzyme Elp3 [Candidatus Moranbacteria bacterium]|nr:tRNA uridine(34) 5-carboxymethylaminomethyl modification radical SAM/GNAT enzyme Elp3 [Candidatus Moranbacteria bacterium]